MKIRLGGLDDTRVQARFDHQTPTAAVHADRFVEDGYLVIRDAISPGVLRDCVSEIERELRQHNVDPHDSKTWTRPVVRFNCPETPAFVRAGTSAVLWDAYDLLLGPERWIRRQGVGGTIPVRFPSTQDPGDAGWHIDGSYEVNGQYWVNVQSRGRGLLALFLFSDISDRDAPTELIVGSHLDVPRILEPFHEVGTWFGSVVASLPASTFNRPRTLATGHAGDVFLCHPFLVHRATWPHRGIQPRIVAQPAIALQEPFQLRQNNNVCFVEQAILRGLA